VKSFRVEPGSRVSLAEWDPGDHSDFEGGKKKGVRELSKLRERLDELQALLYAEHRQKVLVVLQAMDAAGKDGTIRSVFEGVNPQGVVVTSFKVPTQLELDHDFLWRVHRHTPASGEVAIFNRSHYEDVLVTRVHGLVDRDTCARRYAQINDFERMLAEEGTTILKFFLHVDPEEQKSRLQERLQDPRKRWKFRHADVEERKLWDDYMAAYEDALSATSTEWAPWHIVPSNHNWYRNLHVVNTIVDALESLDMHYPQPQEGWESEAIV
jgi:PPK2 family polyphosphate:nucleotide phosphotransferase